jgi:hypothetical protein
MWDQRLEEELAALWKYGVLRIQDEHLREVVARFLCIVPRIFFVDHASRSGRFHPSWQNRRHGTLRSIIESCVVLPGMARHIPEILDDAMNPASYAIDVALAATIISDTWKKEDEGDVHHGPEHGRVAADHWRRFAAEQSLNPRVVEDVYNGCFWHFGIYTPEWKSGTVLTATARLVNLCDVTTSLTELDRIYIGKPVIL